MQRGKENYEGKEIVILGGGDGALLWELLKEKPKFVYMLEVGIILMCCCLPALFQKENKDDGISYNHIHMYNYGSLWSRCWWQYVTNLISVPGWLHCIGLFCFADIAKNTIVTIFNVKWMNTGFASVCNSVPWEFQAAV